MARQSMREEIVEAAVEQFHIHGYNAAGVKDITVAAGVPKGSFYNHFESKEVLAVVALERYGSTRRLAELTDASVDPLVRLRAHFEFLRDEQLGYGLRRGCMFGDFGNEISDHSELIRATVRTSLNAWGAALATAIAQAQTEARRDGRPTADLAPETLAAFILQAWEGALISARAERSEAAFEPFFRTVFGVLLG